MLLLTDEEHVSMNHTRFYMYIISSTRCPGGVFQGLTALPTKPYASEPEYAFCEVPITVTIAGHETEYTTFSEARTGDGAGTKAA